MRTKKLLAVATGLVVCVMLVWFSKSIQGSPKTYEVHPEINIPEYRTDASRAIDARIETNLGTVVRKLDSIDRKLTELSARMSRIEKTLGTLERKLPVQKKPPSKSPDKKARKKPSPSS